MINNGKKRGIVMTSMIFKHFNGTDKCSTAEEIKNIFYQDRNGVNEFIVTSNSDAPYPYLSILVNGNSAYIFYTPFDDSIGAGFQVYGEDEDGFELDPDDKTIFYVNTPAEEIEISNEYVCSREKAIQVTLAFMNCDEWPSCYEDLPNCVEWEEL